MMFVGKPGDVAMYWSGRLHEEEEPVLVVDEREAQYNTEYLVVLSGEKKWVHEGDLHTLEEMEEFNRARRSRLSNQE